MAKPLLCPPKTHSKRFHAKFRLNILANLLPSNAIKNAVGKEIIDPHCPLCVDTLDDVHHSLTCPNQPHPPLCINELIEEMCPFPNANAGKHILKTAYVSNDFKKTLAGLIPHDLIRRAQRAFRTTKTKTSDFILSLSKTLSEDAHESFSQRCAAFNTNNSQQTPLSTTTPETPTTHARLSWHRPCDICHASPCNCPAHKQSTNISEATARLQRDLLQRRGKPITLLRKAATNRTPEISTAATTNSNTVPTLYQNTPSESLHARRQAPTADASDPQGETRTTQHQPSPAHGRARRPQATRALSWPTTRAPPPPPHNSSSREDPVGFPPTPTAHAHNVQREPRQTTVAAFLRHRPPPRPPPVRDRQAQPLRILEFGPTVTPGRHLGLSQTHTAPGSTFSLPNEGQ
jgi:hypothetical protein